MTEEELRTKLDKVEECRALQEEKVHGIEENLEKIKTRYNKEVSKLNAISAEKDKIKGRLCDTMLLEYGITSLSELEKLLKANREKKNGNKIFSKETENAKEDIKENVTNETKSDVT